MGLKRCIFLFVLILAPAAALIAEEALDGPFFMTPCSIIWSAIGRFSETLGYGKLDDPAHAIRFVFEYPDSPFVNTYMFNPKTKSWTSIMRQKEKGQWSTFAEDKITSAEEKK
jgi:hypothetical protein